LGTTARDTMQMQSEGDATFFYVETHLGWISFFLRCFQDPIRSLESAKIIIGSLESEKSGPYRSIPGA